MNSILKNKLLNNKRVAVLGAGISGLSASRLLKKLNAKVFISDKNKKVNLKEVKKNSSNHELGVHSEKILDNELIVISPGIPQDLTIFKKAKSKKIPVISEIELSSWFTNLPIIAITGSNGKTTTMKLLQNIFNQTNLNVFISGNIGIPFSKIVLNNIEKNIRSGVHIVEVSSFQLENIIDFRPNIAIVLNISEDHLDRYGSMKNYIKAKMKISLNMTSKDTLIFNLNNSIIKENIKTNAKLVGFSSTKIDNNLFFLKDKKIFNSKKIKLIDFKEINLIGDHNLENILAAATASKVFHISIEKIRIGIAITRAVKYRLEKVNTINNITFYNDSKSTNVDSLIVAINSFNKNLFLILGGRDKGGDFKKINFHLREKVKQIIIFGESKELIEKQIKEIIPIYKVNSIKEAIEFSFKNAKSGDSILLSPGCSSFDTYKNFEDRGKDFNNNVKMLAK